MIDQTSFHDVRFPTDISVSSSGGPVRSTEIVNLGSGGEQRNQRWSLSRRRYDAGFGAKDLTRLQEIVSFFEARRGQLYSFRFKDPLDHKSSTPATDITSEDQNIGIGDGSRAEFQLTKSYGDEPAFIRTITKPVLGSVSVAVDGETMASGVDYELDHLTGLVVFLSPPGVGQNVTAGFSFDVSVRFENDELSINLAAFSAGDIPNIPLIEVRA